MWKLASISTDLGCGMTELVEVVAGFVGFDAVCTVCGWRSQVGWQNRKLAAEEGAQHVCALPASARPLAGIDPALTNTGIVTNVGGVRESVTVRSKPIPKGDRNPHGHSARIESLANQVALAVPLGALVAIEGPAFGAKFGNPDERAGLRWSIIARLRVRGCRVVIIPPKSGKAWLAENGNAKKDAMIAAAEQHVPELTHGEHEADAYAMLSMLEYEFDRTHFEPGVKGLDAHGKVSWEHLVEGV